MPLRGKNQRSAFSLLELLIVLAIIAILIGLLFVGVQKAREASLRAACMNNLKQLGVALTTYHDTNQGLPPGHTDATFKNAPQQYCLTFILPYIEQNNVYNQITLTKSGYDPINLPAFSTPVATFMCPATPTGPTIVYPSGASAAKYKRLPRNMSEARLGRTDYATVFTSRGQYVANSVGDAHPDLLVLYETQQPPPGLFGLNTSYRFTDATDGTSTTMMLVEDAGRPSVYGPNMQLVKVNSADLSAGAWGDSDSFVNVGGADQEGNQDSGPCAVNCSSDNEVYAFHHAGAHVLMADGSVHLIRKTATLADISAMLSRAGGDIVANTALY